MCYHSLKKLWCFYVCIVFFCWLGRVLALSLEEDDTCVLSTGEGGICKIVTNCSYALNLLRNSETPNVCGFEGRVPIVCCKTTQGASGSPSPLGISATTPTPNKNIGALSRKKCVEFYPRPRFPVFVAGGKPSLVREFPHMAIIGFGEENDVQWQCGGSLISKNFVLTAAHCLTSKYLGDARWVSIGDLDLSTDKDDARPQNFTVKRRIPHPSYSPPLKYHDIALLELDRNVTLNAYRTPACLNTARYLKQKRLTATGWGKTGFIGAYSSFLLKVDLKYVRNSQCNVSFENTDRTLLPNGIVDDFQICAGGVVGEDTCQGDSGGPLQVKNEERSFKVHVHTVIGVTSFGKPCGLSNAPGIYTRVSNYIPWIESIVWPNETA